MDTQRTGDEASIEDSQSHTSNAKSRSTEAPFFRVWDTDRYTNPASMAISKIMSDTMRKCVLRGS